MLFKSLKNLKKKGRLRNCSRLKETKKTKQLNTTYNPGLDPGPEKDISGAIEINQSSFPDLHHCIIVIEIVNI
jgi:hypothetical protein